MTMMNTDERRLAEELHRKLPPAHARRFTIEVSSTHITLQFDNSVLVPGIPGTSDLWDCIEACGLRVTGLNFQAKTVVLESRF